MKEEVSNKEEVKTKVKRKLVSIIPLKDFVIKFNEFYYDIKKGKEIRIDEMFLPNLKTEKVIK